MDGFIIEQKYRTVFLSIEEVILKLSRSYLKIKLYVTLSGLI